MAGTTTDVSEITCEVVGKVGVLSESPAGWKKELRIVNWNKVGPRYDLREWAPGDRRITRGITLSLKEMHALQELLMETEFPESWGEKYPDGDGSFSEEAVSGGNGPEGAAKRKAG